MRIINLEAENYKRLVAVDITPNGAIVDIVGRNAQGKSSVLDAIYAALAGGSAIPSKPIRRGEKESKIELTLGDGKTVAFVVRRIFTRREDDTFTTSVVVENAEGARYKSPQTLLDGLMGALSFDPLEFTRMDSAKQLQQLRKLVPGVDFDAIDAANRGDYERRTDINRRAKVTAAQIGALAVPGDPRVTRVDESALVAELEAAGDAKTAIVREANQRDATQRQIADDLRLAGSKRDLAKARRDRVEKMRADIADLERLADEDDAVAKDYADEAVELETGLLALQPLATPPDTSALKARIDAARKTNADVDERERVIKQRANLQELLDELDAASKVFTAAIEKRDAEKAAAVAAANLPAEGLTLGAGEVLLNGLPLDQASDAERLRASVSIAAAMNPKLRVIRVRDGSLLDEEGLRMLGEFAEKHDLQVWIERVATDARVGIVIEDGRVKAADAAA